MGEDADKRGDLVSLVAGVVLLLGTFQLFTGALAAGVTWDEPHHVDRTEAWLTGGWYVPDRFLVDGEPAEEDPRSSPYVYGPGFSSLAHLANVAAGTESLGEVSRSARAYEVRHLVTAALGLLTAAAVGVSVWALTNSLRFGLWGAAGLLAVPVWMGHSFFNVKDVPAAAGCTLITTALVIALRQSSEAHVSWLRRLAISTPLGLGIFVGVGTRTALWVFLAASLALYAVLDLGRRRFAGLVPAAGATASVLIGSLAGLASVAAAYPRNAVVPWTWLIRSVTDSSGYAWSGYTLTAGRLLPEQPPWWYLPAWLFGSYPVLLTVLAVLGAVVAGRSWWVRNAHLSPWSGLWSRQDLGVLLVFQQALLLPLGAIFTNAVMYSGVRQHLYTVPAVAVLAGLGAHALWQQARTGRGSRPWKPFVVAAMLSVALIVPMVEQTLLFPYNYAYINPVAGIGGVNDRWETDYWGASFPEAISRVPREADVRCENWLIRPWDPDRTPSFGGCGRSRFGPHEHLRGAAAGDVDVDPPEVWVVGRKGNGNYPPPYCESAGDVTRWLRGEQVTMAFVLRCDAEQMPED